MSKTTAILGLLIFVLVIVSIISLIRATTLQRETKDYEELSESVLDFLSISSVYCNANKQTPQALKLCVTRLIDSYAESSFQETGFMPFNSRDNTSGYLVVKNTGIKTFDSDSFRLFLNREPVDSGCVVPGNITKEVACKMFFDRTCERGDLLELKYNDKVLFMKNC